MRINWVNIWWIRYELGQLEQERSLYQREAEPIIKVQPFHFSNPPSEQGMPGFTLRFRMAYGPLFSLSRNANGQDSHKPESITWHIGHQGTLAPTAISPLLLSSTHSSFHSYPTVWLKTWLQAPQPSFHQTVESAYPILDCVLAGAALLAYTMRSKWHFMTQAGS